MLENYLQQTEKDEVKLWINSVLKNYLKTNPENMGEIEHIIDFLNSKKAPKRLKKMSYQEAHVASQKWVKTMIKKARNIVETEEDTKLVKDFGDGIRLVELVGESAFKREGKLMSHCVSSYHGKDGIHVYSLRDSKNNPHCTMEIQKGEDGRINQIKGKGNGSIHPKYIKYVLKSLKKIGKKVRTSEMTNLGYIQMEYDGEFDLLNKIYGDKLKHITFQGELFVYKHCL